MYEKLSESSLFSSSCLCDVLLPCQWTRHDSKVEKRVAERRRETEDANKGEEEEREEYTQAFFFSWSSPARDLSSFSLIFVLSLQRKPSSSLIFVLTERRAFSSALAALSSLFPLPFLLHLRVFFNVSSLSLSLTFG